MKSITFRIVLSQVALHHHMKTFTKSHQCFHVLIGTRRVQILCVTRNGPLCGILINNHGSFSSINCSSKCWLLGCKLFNPPIFEHGSFGSILAFITMFFVIYSLITLFWLLFSLFSLYPRRRWELSCSQLPHSMYVS